ncbi:MAG: DNA-binding protein WhiA [Eubacteriales bacterium]|nr:DNA-binding protein WhiA [Eubacteriales bacterium]
MSENLINDNFIEKLRQELLKQLVEDRTGYQLVFNTVALAAFRFQGREVRFSTHNLAFAQYLQLLFGELYDLEVDLTAAKSQAGIHISSLPLSRLLRDNMEQFSREGMSYFNEDLGQEEALKNLGLCLSALFLACGSLASPQDAYHLEFALQRQLALDFFDQLFQHFELDFSSLRHQGYFVLYVKDGGSISDFLLLAQAHQAMLAFENLRVEKDMFNRVNRVVNCDQANAQRVANSSAKQRRSIQVIMDYQQFDRLPVELQEVALLRMENPELSLAELGQKLSPPLGKSGVNHRLKRIEEFASDLSER